MVPTSIQKNFRSKVYPLVLLFLLGIITNKLTAQNQPNIIFILSDDHRYDFMGFTGKVPWLETPGIDKLAKEGVHYPKHHQNHQVYRQNVSL